MANEWKPTYDTFTSKEAADKDAARRSREAAENGSGRIFAVKKTGGNVFQKTTWTVMYKEPSK